MTAHIRRAAALGVFICFILTHACVQFWWGPCQQTHVPDPNSCPTAQKLCILKLTQNPTSICPLRFKNKPIFPAHPVPSRFPGVLWTAPPWHLHTNVNSSHVMAQAHVCISIWHKSFCGGNNTYDGDQFCRCNNFQPHRVHRLTAPWSQRHGSRVLCCTAPCRPSHTLPQSGCGKFFHRQFAANLCHKMTNALGSRDGRTFRGNGGKLTDGFQIAFSETCSRTVATMAGAL